MPELPEVETVVAGLKQAGLEGRRIASVRVLWRRSVLPATPAALDCQLAGRRILSLQRRAKYICMVLDSGAWLLMHLRMSGRLGVVAADTPPDRHDRILLILDDGRELRLHDTRKFARMCLVSGPLASPLCDLGVEPLTAAFTVARLTAILRRHRMLKPLLLDQHAIAGIGNIYADEALWDARIHPMRRADTLDAGEVVRLRSAIRRVLRRAIRAGGTSLGSGQANFLDVAQQWGANTGNLRVFRRQGRACSRCATRLERMIVAQRATHYCPECQPPG